MTVATLITALTAANPSPEVPGADANAVATAATAKAAQLQGTATAVDTHIKTYLLQLLQALITPGCYNTAVGPAVPGPTLIAFLTQLGAQAPPVAPAPTLPDDQIAKIKMQVIQELQRDYVLTPR